MLHTLKAQLAQLALGDLTCKYSNDWKEACSCFSGKQIFNFFFFFFTTDNVVLLLCCRLIRSPNLHLSAFPHFVMIVFVHGVEYSFCDVLMLDFIGIQFGLYWFGLLVYPLFQQP